MKTLIVTGGAGTGKSTFCRHLLAAVPRARLFDCDQAVHGILTRPDVVRLVAQEFGEAVLGPDRQIERARLREIVFDDPARRSALEAIIHPLVRKDCLADQEDADRAGECPLFVVDVPLFYESNFPVPHDDVIVVAADRAVQTSRLRERTGLSTAAVQAILAAQWPVERKVKLAPRVAWNDGSNPGLQAQAQLLAATIIEYS